MQYAAAVEQSIPTCQIVGVRPLSKNSASSKVGKASVVAAAGHGVAAAEDDHLKCYCRQSTWLALLVQERSRKRFRGGTADAYLERLESPRRS